MVNHRDYLRPDCIRVVRHSSRKCLVRIWLFSCGSELSCCQLTPYRYHSYLHAHYPYIVIGAPLCSLDYLQHLPHRHLQDQQHIIRLPLFPSYPFKHYVLPVALSAPLPSSTPRNPRVARLFAQDHVFLHFSHRLRVTSCAAFSRFLPATPKGMHSLYL